MDGSIIQVFSQRGKSFQNVFFLPRKEHGYTIPMAAPHWVGDEMLCGQSWSCEQMI